MAAHLSLRSSSYLCNPKAVVSTERFDSKFDSLSAPRISAKEPERLKIGKNARPIGYVSKPRMAVTPGALSSMATNSDFSIEDYSPPVAESCETDANRVNHLVRLLHECANGFSVATQKHELARTGSPLAMAWNGIDVDAWHKRIAYPVAAYALLKAASEVEQLLSHSSKISLVNEILFPCTYLLRVNIEIELSKRNPKLVQWFNMVELHRLAGYFIPVFKKWSADSAGSGIAGTILGITSAASVRNIGFGRISFSLFPELIDQALLELMTMAHEVVSLRNLHHLAIEAGFEQYFLSHFGSRVLPCKKSEDIEFWIGLVHRKLSVALDRESVLKGSHSISDKVEASSLSTLALFAYLGTQSRLFLSKQNINEADEKITKLLSYLECGILFIYPEFSTISAYQLLMEVVIDELQWLNIFSKYNVNICREGRTFIQAEKEIIFYTVFTIYDLFLGFAHYTGSTQQTLDSHVLEFLVQSQGLLSACLTDYWVADDGNDDLPTIREKTLTDSAPSFRIRGTKNGSLVMMDALQLPDEVELRIRENIHKTSSSQTEATTSSPGTHGDTSSDSDQSSNSRPIRQNFVKKSLKKLVSASVDIWMGTQLLFVDISEFMRFLVKKCSGRNMTRREGQKMQRTLCDLATLVPVTILMLLPVSAVGHAAMFTAIKKYVPCLIPSPYTDERINLVKQLKRTKKMEIERVNVEEVISKAVNEPIHT